MLKQYRLSKLIIIIKVTQCSFLQEAFPDFSRESAAFPRKPQERV